MCTLGSLGQRVMTTFRQPHTVSNKPTSMMNLPLTLHSPNAVYTLSQCKQTESETIKSYCTYIANMRTNKQCRSSWYSKFGSKTEFQKPALNIVGCRQFSGTEDLSNAVSVLLHTVIQCLQFGPTDNEIHRNIRWLREEFSNEGGR